MPKSKRQFVIPVIVVIVAASLVMLRGSSSSQGNATDVKPTNIQANPAAETTQSSTAPDSITKDSIAHDSIAQDSTAKGQQDDSPTRIATMDEVLNVAQNARDHIATTLDDYTARFVKQEVESNGSLGPETVIDMKVQTRLRNESDDAPMRVYLRFKEPTNLNGREVLWCQDLHDGKMAVHEVGFLLGFKTIWLDPNGMVAMTGQRYPISEIGLVKLCEKLIERGEKDRNNPDVTVTITRNHQIDGVPAELIQVRRSKPGTDEEEDFSLAEISIDPKRQLILQYRSFGWPDKDAATDSPPLQESYTYKDIQTNVGLTDADFDYQNPSYNFP